MLKAFDMFKGNPRMHFKGEKGGYSSWLGQIMTIIVLGLGSSLLVYFCLNMIFKTNPDLQSFPISEIDDLIITDEVFPFAFGVLDADGNYYVDERIYTVEAVSDNFRIPFQMIPCKPTHFDHYDPSKEGPLWCFAKEQKPGSEVKFSSSDNLTINLHKCDKRENPNCYDEKEIDKLLFGNRVRIFRKQFGFDADNYHNPITERTAYTTISVSTAMVKESYFYINRFYYDTDDGWFFSNLKREYRLNANTFIEYFEDTAVMGNIFKQIGFDTNNQSTRLLRKYDNVPSIFARWNGMFTIMLIIGKIISDAYNQFKTQETLIKDILFIKNRKSRAQKIRNRIKQEYRVKKSIQLPDVKISSDGQEMQSEGQNNDDILSLSLVQKNLHAEVESHHSSENPQSNLNNSKGYHEDRANSIVNNFKTSKQDKEEKSYQSPEGINISPKKFPDEFSLSEYEIYNHNDSEANNVHNQSEAKNIIKEPKKNIEIKVPKKKKPKASLTDTALGGSEEEEPAIGFWTWFRSKLKLTAQYKLFLEREKIIKKEFDFQSHVKRFIEVDVLKYLLFNKDQLAVFDNCVKAYVNLKLNSVDLDNCNTNKKLEDHGKNSCSHDEEDDALFNLRRIHEPDQTTKKILHLMEVLFPVEENTRKRIKIKLIQ